MPSSEPGFLLVFDQGLAALAMALRSVLEAFSLATVVLGLLITLRQAWRARRRGPSAFQAVRLTFGSWLAMALEFQLGADIVATSTSPTGAHLVQLGVVAVIRTLLNVFLARDLEAEASHRSLSPQGRP
ncbi:DUF1622 domain-containing protein [Synechococcus sp. CBW1108]|jgi:uncharacterized membrane protein|uniref:DUF1622 domain-containing protein n=1 Tax=Synechococcus sp. CBW1108 TaxID=1353147 RepID=UPI0018CD4F1F|nr:DUF1622 domain-containing protein [Synechococcus sp. CBW1108]QPN70577.1 DUF1622 domain-containing protein [Synechococcus sp. CBW1108]